MANVSTTFGYFFKNNKDTLPLDVMNVASYIPVVQVAAGGFRILNMAAHAHKMPSDHKPFIASQIVRGAYEIFCPGWLLAIPDICMTVNRHWDFIFQKVDGYQD